MSSTTLGVAVGVTVLFLFVVCGPLSSNAPLYSTAPYQQHQQWRGKVVSRGATNQLLSTSGPSGTPPPPQSPLLWKFRTGGAITTTPAVSSDGKIVYVTSTDRTLYAVDAHTGRTVWNYNKVDGEDDDDDLTGVNADLGWSSPILHNEQLYLPGHACAPLPIINLVRQHSLPSAPSPGKWSGTSQTGSHSRHMAIIRL
jgi:hypothetical protein